jgi:hypothetical protein
MTSLPNNNCLTRRKARACSQRQRKKPPVISRRLPGNGKPTHLRFDADRIVDSPVKRNARSRFPCEQGESPCSIRRHPRVGAGSSAVFDESRTAHAFLTRANTAMKPGAF